MYIGNYSVTLSIMEHVSSHNTCVPLPFGKWLIISKVYMPVRHTNLVKGEFITLSPVGSTCTFEFMTITRKARWYEW